MLSSVKYCNWHWWLLCYRTVGCKETIVVSQVIQMSFLVAQWWPSYYTMVPAAILTGLASSLIWVSVSMYVTIQAQVYSVFSNETVQTVAVRLFGIFFTVCTLCQVLGDFISSTGNNSNHFVVWNLLFSDLAKQFRVNIFFPSKVDVKVTVLRHSFHV